jgi:hypothetical protein
MLPNSMRQSAAGPVGSGHDPLLDEDAAAERLGVKAQTLSVWRTTKRYPLAYIKVGRNVRYKLSAIEAFLESRTITPGSGD